MKATKWKKRDRKFKNNKFSFNMRQKKNCLKAQKCSKFHRRDSLHDRMFELIIHAKAKAWVFPTSFAVILSTVALFSKVQAAALNPRSVFKTHLKAHRSSCFSRGWRKEKLFAKKVWRPRSPFDLRPPRIMFFLSILSAKEVSCPF